MQVAGNVLDARVIIVPINLSNHWLLTTLDLQEHIVRFYDSLKFPMDEIVKNLCIWVQHTAATSIGPVQKWSLQPSTVWKAARMDVPFQGDTTECGMFLLSTALSLTAGGPIQSTLQDMPRLRVQFAHWLLSSSVPAAAGKPCHEEPFTNAAGEL
ncbi:Sentrin-specific protease 3 [Tetrabaena socialis]|uniref:Sentrin-specific protease 3 n=1 Tax=Tetrabaena socialis TaxID=47790 RepID=A0A2J7ZN34_9CHLO|nr:Sentrin-specific protease 3 [Tetrabaena socialis]|eukprot:PNH01684.1 Sentrin-specific protease 3 [Tetrabaena socialis]